MGKKGWWVLLALLLTGSLISGCTMQLIASETSWENRNQEAIEEQDSIQEEPSESVEVETEDTITPEQENLVRSTRGSEGQNAKNHDNNVSSEEIETNYKETQREEGKEPSKEQDVPKEQEANTKDEDNIVSPATYVGIIQYYYALPCQECEEQKREFQKWLTQRKDILQQVMIEMVDVGRNDPRIASGELKVEGLPFFILLDEEGNLATTASGTMKAPELDQLLQYLVVEAESP
ncbi:TlpA family protein disulfide reductase [Heliorestis convoluta]|uniref:N-acetylmuramoyl-L-alanine amidase n=1 Tax=Heliorestis convoluta TaxID=356322 RepID=A0A5Q2N0V4_9FIRM|nr:hypothetical protein [Heliorestis convoluta]QGG48497.1 N-acetylmuramoyl-L-alanine amidase [Heliorestis convoluta]